MPGNKVKHQQTKDLKAKQVKIREEFPETWLWSDEKLE